MGLKLDAASRGRWLVELAALIEAGLPIGLAVNSVAEGMQGKNATLLRGAASAVNKGSSFAEVAKRFDILDKLSLRVIELGEHSGDLGRVLRRLAKLEESRAKLQRQLRSRMMMPVAVVLIAVLVAPLPELVGGLLSVSEYLVNTIGLLMGIAICLWLFINGLLWTRKSAALAAGLDRFELVTPIWGAMRIRQCNTDFLDSLSLSYSAGIPLVEAFNLSTLSIMNSRVRNAFEQAARQLKLGKTLVESLEVVHYLDRSILELIRSGELSGRVEETLERLVAWERQRLESDNRQVGDLLPRIFYFTVVIWMVSQILGSGLGSPV